MLWFSQPSQLWPEFRGEEVVAKGSKHRRQDGGGAGREKGQHRPGWGGMLPLISGLKVTWGRLSETPSSRQIHEEYRSSFKGAMRKQMSVSNSKFELFCTLCQEILNQVPLVFFGPIPLDYGVSYIMEQN